MSLHRALASQLSSPNAHSLVVMPASVVEKIEREVNAMNPIIISLQCNESLMKHIEALNFITFGDRAK